MDRREYNISLTINGRKITKAIIDPHYEERHANSINDDLILRLVGLLNGGTFPIEESKGSFDYYVTDNMILDNKNYKLIWLLEKDKIYIGIINAYRRGK